MRGRQKRGRGRKRVWGSVGGRRVRGRARERGASALKLSPLRCTDWFPGSHTSDGNQTRGKGGRQAGGPGGVAGRWADKQVDGEVEGNTRMSGQANDSMIEGKVTATTKIVVACFSLPLCLLAPSLLPSLPPPSHPLYHYVLPLPASLSTLSLYLVQKETSDSSSQYLERREERHRRTGSHDEQ